MATVNKDFRVKHGLVVEGSTGTIGGNDILVDGDSLDLLVEGTTNLFYTDQKVKDVLTGSTQTNISITEVEGDLIITAESGIEEATTDDLDEGTTNLYFTSQRALDATASAYDLVGAAGDVQDNLDAHTEASSDVHGVTGSVVGTTDTQDISNKRIVDTLYFTDGVTISDEGEIAVKPTTHQFEIKANYGDLDLKTVATAADVNIISDDGDILLNPDGFAYLTSKDEANKIATHAYVDAATAGINVHDSVKAATVENINLATALENGDILDGVTLATGNRVLVKDQTTKTQNGVYVVQVSGAAVRAEDYNSPPEVDAGDFIFVEGGDTNGKTGWVQTNTITTVGSDNIEFTQFSGAGTYSGGTGINLDGNIIELDFTEFDTDDIDEGTTNLYYTTQRAKDDAAALLTGATLTNITITGDGDGLTITAENGVDDATTDDLSEGTTNLYHTAQRVKDILTGSTQTNISITEVEGDLVINVDDAVENSTTDDLDEGTTNLYFTDQRAVDALEAVVPNFDAVEVNSVAKQIAATVTLPTAEVVGTAYSFAHAEYRTGKFLVKMAAGSHTEVVEVLLTLDSSNNIAITQYAMVGTNGELGVIDAILGGTGNADVLLRVEPNNNTTVVNVYGTLLV